MKISNMIKASIKLLLISLVIFSLIYPVMVGGIGQIWSNKSKGSMIEYNNEIVGSELIGQQFTGDQYFHSRPSSINYEAGQSASANIGPDNPRLTQRVEKSIEKLKEERISTENIPADIVTESGSALDPHISPESAYLQINRTAEITDISRDKLENIIEETTESKFLGIFGHKRINVLKLNIRITEVLNQ